MGTPLHSLQFFERPAPYGDKSLVLTRDKAISDFFKFFLNFFIWRQKKEQEKGGFGDEQKGPVVDLARRADEFIRDVEKGGKACYFVSSKCLLRLEENQRQSLLSILWKGGYSEIYQTTTTTLFARLKSDDENRIAYYGASSVFKERSVSGGDLDDVRPSTGDDDLLGSAGRGVNLVRSCNTPAGISKPSPCTLLVLSQCMKLNVFLFEDSLTKSV